MPNPNVTSPVFLRHPVVRRRLSLSSCRSLHDLCLYISCCRLV